MFNLGRSVGFRLAFYYGFLMTITMIVTISIIYMQTVGVLYQGTVRQVGAVSEKLAARFDSGGAPALIKDIEQALSDDQNAATEVFLYVDPHGVKLAGNLDQPPAHMDRLPGGDRIQVLRGGKYVVAYVSIHAMPDGSRLLVGDDLHDQLAIDSLVTRGIVIASAVGILLLVGGLVAFRQELQRSVEAIRGTLTRVGTGAIRERVLPLGKEDEFALLGRDINKMLDRIEALMNGVRHVSDIIAHNLRTPLTRIVLRLRTSAEDAGVDLAQKRTIETAIRDIEELISVFEKLLQIAEAEAGARRIGFESVAFSSVVGEVVDFYQAVADEQGAQLAFSPASDAVVLGDADLLAGVVANLVDNALKYSGAGASVTIEFRVTREHVLLTVRDNGPGIAAAHHGKLGTRFFRLDRSISGHGLGLANVTAVVALHGGRIWFEHADPGLVVCMEFPRHKP